MLGFLFVLSFSVSVYFIFPKVCVVNEIWQAFDDNYLNSIKGSRMPECMNKELLADLTRTKEAHKRWKQGQVNPKGAWRCCPVLWGWS